MKLSEVPMVQRYGIFLGYAPAYAQNNDGLITVVFSASHGRRGTAELTPADAEELKRQTRAYQTANAY